MMSSIDSLSKHLLIADCLQENKGVLIFNGCKNIGIARTKKWQWQDMLLRM